MFKFLDKAIYFVFISHSHHGYPGLDPYPINTFTSWLGRKQKAGSWFWSKVAKVVDYFAGKDYCINHIYGD